jgi:hypothetical protein
LGAREGYAGPMWQGAPRRAYGALGFAVATAIGAASSGCAARPPAPVVVVDVATDNRTPAAKATAESDVSAGNAAVARPVDPADEDAVLREVLASIREISPTEHAIKRRGLDLFLEHNEMFARSARIVPDMSGGKVLGMRMFGIRADGFFAKLGFENGDRIERIMGKPLTDPEGALAIYAAMRGAKDVEIELTRRGTVRKHIVHIE